MTGRPAAIRLWNRGMTLTAKANTLPKTHRNESCTGTCIEMQTVDLSHTLRRPHHVRGIDRLVDGDHCERFTLVLIGQRRQHLRAKDIVVHGHTHLIFQQRHVLVRGRVKNDTRAMCSEGILPAAAVRRRARLTCNLACPVAKKTFVCTEATDPIAAHLSRPHYSTRRKFHCPASIPNK